MSGTTCQHKTTESSTIVEWLLIMYSPVHRAPSMRQGSTRVYVCFCVCRTWPSRRNFGSQCTFLNRTTPDRAQCEEGVQPMHCSGAQRAHCGWNHAYRLEYWSGVSVFINYAHSLLGTREAGPWSGVQARGPLPRLVNVAPKSDILYYSPPHTQ